MMESIRAWLTGAGLGDGGAGCVAAILGLAIAGVFAWISRIIARYILLRAVHHVVKKTKYTWDDALVERKVFNRIAHFVPGYVLYATAGVVFAGYETGETLMRLGAMIYMVLVGLLVVDGFLNAVVDIYRTFDFARRMPIRGLIQVVKIVLYLAAGVIVISLLLDKNPSKLLTGMGALTAVLMLVFKDAILGFVAGIQLIANRMVHIGDWIEMSKYGADGDVIDITLTTVKVQNWDKTIVMIPAYALISDSFRNWRGMSDSGGRRIKRAVNIDVNSIKFCTAEMVEKFRKFECIGGYIEGKEKELAEYNASEGVDESVLVNGRRMTNVGTFRAYVAAYLRNHPMVNLDMTFMVRQLAPTAQGLPIQVYVFCKDQRWVNYEGIQGDIFDHILAVIPQFGLRVFQEPAGADFNSEFIVRSK